ncbi:hypothetical protein LC76P1_00238 [Lysinibacillus phage LC76P1]|nr:hypothetical protein LC76P1_00238 [Lysinibacillus phage LC76P1]
MKRSAFVPFSLNDVVEVQLTGIGTIIMELNLLREFGFIESLSLYAEKGRIGLVEGEDNPIVRLELGRLLELCDDIKYKFDDIFMGDFKLIVYEYDDEDGE